MPHDSFPGITGFFQAANRSSPSKQSFGALILWMLLFLVIVYVAGGLFIGLLYGTGLFMGFLANTIKAWVSSLKDLITQ
jgi:hypothetical protein